MLLKDKVAIVTGAASARGLGRATAKLFAEQGAKVVIADLDEQASIEAANALPGEGHLGVAINVADEAQVQAAKEKILAKYGRIDVLVNNAGITQPLKVMDIKGGNYDAVLDVSLRGTLLMSQAVIPTMRAQKSGSIVCISSVSAQRGGGIFGGPHYSAAKAGVLGLAKAMARELGIDGIRVNCITPGLIQTDITQGKLSDEQKANIIAGIPLNRLGDAVDIARAALFLASDLASYSTGITLDVNGGMHIH
ncbi:SDR family NAD(P)-dependent oxidoreductase [Testudinibacter aquarius]|uniref:Glucose 1-dehydrogenase n=1 Tax=Testudinibacter aquarius TaxID=1524974 RepID=A0A4R3YHG2_9PAST|nr:glucose 1-dehydrogenase [Testudinibacter aquarius]TNG92050.1 glucose 1-dehydrogenase [Pasteurellaceae bacterium USgator41]TNG95037.1 glucose 1-dehydrogenase [Pasteurellaceae bacterium UScroc12]TNH01377.1 glucose 1-dehydrogenase [Pasteurellaceae bacterium UScroc31]TNH02499.1 glucose 1-dehydrogenase [Pasteurellaceae bacterium USgator11]KAE9527100.1 short-chain dehydrogenase [Testudinibacter aquarius]